MKDEFKKAVSSYELSKCGTHILTTSFYNGSARIYTSYDFAARMVFSTTGESGSSVSVTPFSEVDRETLENFRDKLIELKGQPPELPALPVAKEPETPKLFRNS